MGSSLITGRKQGCGCAICAGLARRFDLLGMPQACRPIGLSLLGTDSVGFRGRYEQGFMACSLPDGTRPLQTGRSREKPGRLNLSGDLRCSSGRNFAQLDSLGEATKIIEATLGILHVGTRPR